MGRVAQVSLASSWSRPIPRFLMWFVRGGLEPVVVDAEGAGLVVLGVGLGDVAFAGGGVALGDLDDGFFHGHDFLRKSMCRGRSAISSPTASRSRSRSRPGAGTGRGSREREGRTRSVSGCGPCAITLGSSVCSHGLATMSWSRTARLKIEWSMDLRHWPTGLRPRPVQESTGVGAPDPVASRSMGKPCWMPQTTAWLRVETPIFR
jgi:hypothetical protein